MIQLNANGPIRGFGKLARQCAGEDEFAVRRQLGIELLGCNRGRIPITDFDHDQQRITRFRITRHEIYHIRLFD